MNDIGGVEISNKLILAPMANVMTLPLRLAFRRFGFGLVSMGFISAEKVIENEGRFLENLTGQKEETDKRESPLMIQLVGSDPAVMGEAARIISPLADIIDLNLGSSLPWVTQRGFGAALLKDTRSVAALIKTVVKKVSVPVTAKIRLISSQRLSLTLDMARCCEDAGAKGLIVHARTPEQYFSGEAKWDIFPEIKKIIHIPLVGNGGVRHLKDAGYLLGEAGCDFVMVGTSALYSPHAFLPQGANLKKSNFLDFVRCYAQANKTFASILPVAFFDLWRRQQNTKNFIKMCQKKYAMS